MATGDTLARIRLALEGQPAVVSGMKEVERQFASTKQAIAGLVGGLTIAEFASFIKSGIDAADAMDELSERTGLAVKDISGLQVAYKMAGMEGEDLEKSMGRLNKAIADGNKAFDAMGVKTKNADGTFRDVREVLGDVADKFADYEDGAAKSALAQELFGKSGAAMLGVLNKGSEGLAEFDETARKLGLTMDESATTNAAKFNDTLDLLSLGTQGIARQIGAALTPTLSTMAGELLESASNTGTLSTVSTILGGTLKTLYTIAAAGVGVFRVLGKGVGAVAAAFFEVTRGNFSGAWEALKAGSEDIDSVVAGTIASLGRVWNDVGNAGVDAMAGVVRASKTAAPVVADVGKSAKQTKDEFAALLDKINGKQGGIDPNFSKELNTLYEGFTSGRFKGGVNEYVATVERFINQQQFAKDAVAAANQAWDEYFDKQEDARLKNEGQIKTAREMLESIEFETKALKMTNQEREIAISMRELERQGIVKGTQAYEAFAEQIRAAIVTREQTQASVDAQKEQLEGWKSIDKTAHDVFVNVFEDGAGTFKRLGQTLKASLLDMLYQMTVKRWIINIAASLTGQSLDVVSAALGGGSGGSGLLGAASNGMSAYNIFTSANWMGTSGGLLSGLGTAYGNAALGTSLGMTGAEAYAASQAAAIAGGGSVYGSSVGAAAGSGSFGSLGAGATAAGVLALPLVAGVIAAILDNGDRSSGAAYATSSGKDPLTSVRAGSTTYNELTGELPDREALLTALRGYGASEQFLTGNDRTLHQMLLLARDEAGMQRDGGARMNWSQWSQNMAGADFYRGAGYASPDALDWWSVESRYMGAIDPKLVDFSRKLSEGLVGSLKGVSEMLGLGSDYKVASGLGVNPDDRNPIWGGLQIWKDSESTLNWGMKEFQTQGEFLRATFKDTLSTIQEFDGLPEWAQKQIDTTQTKLDGLEVNDQLGANAQAAFAEATSGLSAMYKAIESLIEIVPEFGGASQDAIYNIQSALGGLDQLTSAYSGYVQNFYSEPERFNYVRAGINQSLSSVGLSVDADTTREQFRAMVDAQDLMTESGQQAFVALMQVSSAFAEITPVVDAVAATVAQAVEEMAQSIGSDLTGVLTQGLLGNLTGVDLGGQMADVVIGGAYNALAGNAASQISSIMTEGLISPLLQAVTTNAAISGAITQASIDATVAKAKEAIAAFGAVLNDPAFQEAMKEIDGAIRSITASMPTQSYYDTYAAQQARQQQQAANAAERAAEQVKNAWEGVGDSLLDEVNRIRGEIATTGSMSMAYWESQFAVETAKARAGDVDAAKGLTAISKSLLDAAVSQAKSSLELQQMRAWVAQSLQDSAAYAQAYAGGVATTTVNRGSSPVIAPPPIVGSTPIVVAPDQSLLAENRELRQMLTERLTLISQQQRDLLQIERRRDALAAATT